MIQDGRSEIQEGIKGTEKRKCVCKSVYIFPLQNISNNVNSKWIKDLNVKSKAIMFSEVNIQEYFHDYKIKNFFKAQYSLTIKKNITKLDYIKIKFFKTSLYLKAL